MLIHSRGYGKNIQIENDILWGKTHLIHQNVIGTFGYFQASFIIIGLTHLIKGHNDYCGTITFDQFGLVHKLFFPFF